jgi:hypothetical protein
LFVVVVVGIDIGRGRVVRREIESKNAFVGSFEEIRR